MGYHRGQRAFRGPLNDQFDNILDALSPILSGCP